MIKKIDIAKREFICAVKMFFYEYDCIPTYIVISASAQVTHDLINRDKNINIEDIRKKFKNYNHLYNAFKHAYRDPQKKHKEPTDKQLLASFMITLINIRVLDECFDPPEAKYIYIYSERHNINPPKLYSDSGDFSATDWSNKAFYQTLF